MTQAQPVLATATPTTSSATTPTPVDKQMVQPQNLTLPQLRQQALQANQQGDIKTATTLFSTIVQHRPDDVMAWSNLGAIYFNAKNFASALVCFKRILKYDPNHSRAAINIITTLLKLDRIAEALSVAEALVMKYPDDAKAYANYANALREDAQFEKAIEVFDKAKALDPKDPNTQWSRGQCLLSVGRYDEGFREYESRFHLGTTNLPNKDFGCPMWLGVLDEKPVDLAGKTLLIHEEQGFGDSVLASRFIRQAKDKVGVNGKIILQCKPDLHRLLQQSGADLLMGVKHIPGKNGIPKPDYHCLLMSLPGALGVQVDTIPPPVKLNIPQDSRERFASLGKQYPKDKFPHIQKVGIVWAGSDVFQNNHKRSLGLQAFLPLAERENIRLYSFQKGPYLKNLHDQGANIFIEDVGKHCRDFADTAAAMEHMDYILMNDSSVAHVAASMGKRVVNVMMHSPYWIYTLNKKKTPWYPSMELITRDEFFEFVKA